MSEHKSNITTPDQSDPVKTNKTRNTYRQTDRRTNKRCVYK